MTSLSETQVETVRSMLEEGKSVKDVAEFFHVVRGEMKQFIQAHELESSLINKAYWIWDESEERRLIEEVEEGMALDDIAKLHARTNGGILSRMKILDIDFPESSPSYHPTKKIHRWSDEEVEKLVQLAKDGSTADQIADQMDLPKKSITAKYRKIRKAQDLPQLTRAKPQRKKVSAKKSTGKKKAGRKPVKKFSSSFSDEFEEEIVEIDDEITRKLEKLKARECPFCCGFVNVAFSCGHGSCVKCSKTLKKCDICQKNITRKITLKF